MEVKTKELSLMESEAAVPQQCTLCQAAVSRYTCPRCNVRYCTLECYRCVAHAQCSELFYRDCFIDGLRDMEADSNEKKRMIDMLQRLEQEDAVNTGSACDEADDQDDEDEDDLNDELAAMDLDNISDVEIWKKLPEDKRREFASMIKDGRIGELVPTWEPWWFSAQSVITEVNASPSTTIPSILSGYEDLGRSLSANTRLSETIRYGIISSLYGYAYVARLYNGDHNTATLAKECSHVVLAMFTNSQPTNDVSSAIAVCFKSLERLGNYFVSREFSVSVIEDVSKIVENREYVLAALSDCREMMLAARKDKSVEKSDSGRCPAKTKDNSKSDSEASAASYRHECFQVVKKLEFYLAWMYLYGDVLCALAPVLKLEHFSMISELKKYNADRQNVQKLLAESKMKSSRKLIEEIDDCV